MLKCFFIASYLLINTISYAQQATIGIKLGGNLSTIKGDFGDLIESESRLGIHAGVVVATKVKGVFSLQVESNFSQKGFKSDAANSSIDHRLNYVDIVLLGKITSQVGTGFHFGPQLSVLVSSVLDQEGFPVNKSVDRLNPVPFALCAGVHQKIGPLVEVGFRYNYGLSKVMAARPRFNLTSPDRVAQLYVSLLIYQKRKPML